LPQWRVCLHVEINPEGTRRYVNANPGPLEALIRSRLHHLNGPPFGRQNLILGHWPYQLSPPKAAPLRVRLTDQTFKLQAAFTRERTSGAPLAARKERFCLSDLQAA